MQRSEYLAIEKFLLNSSTGNRSNSKLFIVEIKKGATGLTAIENMIIAFFHTEAISNSSGLLSALFLAQHFQKFRKHQRFGPA